MNENILVLGGSGFMGGHLADELTEAGHNVFLFDIKPSPWLKPNQKMLLGSILDQEQIEKLIKENRISYVYHLAGIADIDECHKEPVKALEYNVLGTAKLLEACVENKVRKFIFASTAYVSSDKGSFYRISKQTCEGLVEEYSKKHGLEYVILRYGSLYGPRSDERNSLYRIIQQALEKKKITYNGSGEEKREFVHVLDAAKLSVRIMNSEFTNKKILITGTRTVQYSELLEMIKEMFGDKIEIEYNSKMAKTHYRLSPYSFKPDIVHKLVGDYHVDFGQGLLSLINELSGEES